MLLCHNPYDRPQPQENSAIMAPLFVCHYNNIHSSAAVGSAEQIRALFFFHPRLARLGKATEEGHSGEGEIRESGHFHIEPIPLNYGTTLL